MQCPKEKRIYNTKKHSAFRSYFKLASVQTKSESVLHIFHVYTAAQRFFSCRSNPYFCSSVSSNKKPNSPYNIYSLQSKIFSSYVFLYIHIISVSVYFYLGFWGKYVCTQCNKWGTASKKKKPPYWKVYVYFREWDSSTRQKILLHTHFLVCIHPKFCYWAINTVD